MTLSELADLNAAVQEYFEEAEYQGIPIPHAVVPLFKDIKVYLEHGHPDLRYTEADLIGVLQMWYVDQIAGG